MRQVFRAGALGRPRGMGWRGRQEGGLGRGTHVNPWLIHVNVWQNQKNKKKKKKKEPACRRHKRGLDPCVRKIAREGNGNLLQYSCLGNPIDRGAWQATVHGVPKSQTLLSTHTQQHTLI